MLLMPLDRLVAGIFFLAISIAATEEAGATESLHKTLLVNSGLQSQLMSVSGIVLSETRQLRLACADRPGFSHALSSYISELFSTDRLTALAEVELESRLSESSAREALGWYESPLGRSIIAAENRSADLNEQEQNDREQSLRSSSSWTEIRRGLIREVLLKTRTHEFVATLNTHISGAVTLASTCADRLDELDILEQQVDKSILDEPLLAMFFLGTLIPPSGVVFEDLSDDDLRDYWRFSDSEVGNALHKALVETLRSTLRANFKSLVLYLEHTRS